VKEKKGGMVSGINQSHTKRGDIKTDKRDQSLAEER
jgi:hypothetical protein